MKNSKLKSLVTVVLSLFAIEAVAQAPAAPVFVPRQAEIVPGQTPTSPGLDEYFTPASDLAAVPDEQGFIRRWILLEPITKPNGSNTVFVDSYIRENLTADYFPCQLSDKLPKDGSKEKIDGSVLRWHALDSKLFNVKLFRFAAGLKKGVYGVIFWAATVVDVPQDMEDVRMCVGSNSASMWWLNGEEAMIMSGDRRMVMDDCASKRLTLKKGRNVIWGAVINGPGMSDFCLRFVDAAGNPVTNLKIYTK